MNGRTSRLWIAGTMLVIGGLVSSLYLIFIRTGLEETLGFSQKIFYFHVPCAWVTYLAFAVSGIASVAYLVRSSPRWDRIAHASLEVGTVFTTLVLVTGPLWAKPAWGVYWVWDARLTTTLILWLIEIAYLLLRVFVEEPGKAAKYCAVMGLLGVIDLPIIHYSVVLWRGIHPDPVVISRKGFGAGLPSEFLLTLMVSLATFTLLYVMLVGVRYRLEVVRERVNLLRQRALER